MSGQRMIRVSVEVCSGSARFRVSVQAETIRRALGLVGGGTRTVRFGWCFP